MIKRLVLTINTRTMKMIDTDPIQAARRHHLREQAREDSSVNDARLNQLADHAIEVDPITLKERFRNALRILKTVARVVGDAMIEQQTDPYMLRDRGLSGSVFVPQEATTM